MAIFQDTYHRARANARKVMLGTAAIVVGGVVVVSPWTPGTSTANLWVDSNGGTCTRQTSPATYSDAAACSSLNAAYAAASGGDTVRVRTGSYGAQTISATAKTSYVTFRADGGPVTLTGALDVQTNFVKIDGQATSAPYDWQVPYHIVHIGQSSVRNHDVTVNHLDGRNFQIDTAYNVNITGGDWGPSVACRTGTYPASPSPNDQLENQITGRSGSSSTPHDIVLDGLYIHDQNTDNAGSCHTGGLIFQGGYNVTIRNTKFEQNAIYDILFDDFTGTFRTDNITLENNWFGPPVLPLPDDTTVQPAASDVQVKWNGVPALNWLVRFNSFSNGLALAWGGMPSSWTNVRVLGNTGGSYWDGTRYQMCAGVGSGVTAKYNAMVSIDNLGSSGSTRATCGDATNVNLGLVGDYGLNSTFPYASTSLSTLNFHLKGAAGSTSADNLVSLTTSDYALTTDIDGEARPAGANRDAGSDER